MATTGYPPQVHRILQIGKETTFGSAAAANRQIFSADCDIDPNIPVTKVMGQGRSSPVGVVIAKEFTKVGLKGEAAFDDMLYIWDCSLKAAAITTPGGATNTRRWTYTPATTSIDTINSLTVQYGDGTINASEVAGVQFDSIELDFKPDKTISFKADGYGKSITDGATMTGSPTAVTLRTMSPRNIDVYLNDDFGDIGTTQIKPAEMKFQLKDRFTPFFALNSSDTSFEANVIKSLSPTAQIVVPHDSDSNAYMTALKEGVPYYLSIVVTGALIEGAFYYTMTINMPVHFEKNARGPNQDTHCATYDLMGFYDTTADYALKVIHDTQRTAL
jgi:hypothetical protein